MNSKVRTKFVGLMKTKNDVAYEQRLITKVEASTMLKSAERFLAWAKKECDSSISST